MAVGGIEDEGELATLGEQRGTIERIACVARSARHHVDADGFAQQLQSYVDDGGGLHLLSSRLGQDLSGFSLDDPVSDLPLPATAHG
jgi:hypothetical protein